MSFVVYDLTFLVLFSLAIGIFLYVRRQKLEREGVLFLYKTKIGLEFIDNFAKKYPKALKFLSYIVVIVGYLLMIASFYFLVQIIQVFLNADLVKLIKVPPIMPLIPYLPDLFSVSWLPPFYFTYWIVAIALVAIFHEGAHGIFARLNNIRIKSSGFGFLGPFLAFFVEQDDKQMVKRSTFSQLTVLSAGVFANTILTIIFFLLMVGFFSAAYAPSGAIFTDYTYSAAPLAVILGGAITSEHLQVNGLNMTKIILENNSYFVSDEVFKLELTEENSEALVKIYFDLPAVNSGLKGAIAEIDGKPIGNSADLGKELGSKKPGETIIATTEYQNKSGVFRQDYELTLAKDYSNSSRAVMGIATAMPSTTGLRGFMYKITSIFRDPNAYYKPKTAEELTIFTYNLLWWIFMINLSVAVMNMLPLGIFDGGRFFYISVLAVTKKKKIAEKAFKYMTWLLLAFVVVLMILWAKGLFLK